MLLRIDRKSMLCSLQFGRLYEIVTVLSMSVFVNEMVLRSDSL